jgi:multiple antibiotic resistance protein
MLAEIARSFLILLATIDPIGTLSIFVGVTASIPVGERARIAVRSVLVGGTVLIGFLIAGQLLLQLLGVGLSAFQLSGGIVLFLFGLQMIFGSVAVPGQTRPEAGHDLAVFPLAIPSIAGPGSILAVVVLTDNQQFTFAEQAVTAMLLCVVLAVTLALMLAANRIHRLIGNSGANIMIRIMGIILCGLATELFLEALAKEFGLAVVASG